MRQLSALEPLPASTVMSAPTVLRPLPSGAASLRVPRFLGVRPRSRRASLLVRISVPLLLLAGWWLGTTSGRIPDSVLASPRAVAGALVELQQTGELREFLLASLSRASMVWCWAPAAACCWA